MVLAESQARGFLGGAPLKEHVVHAVGFARVTLALDGHPPERVVDLGAGGGIPGLVLAILWPTSRLLLIDAHHRRTSFLLQAVGRLELQHHVSVVDGRVEDLAHDPAYREMADLVVARGFGPPSTTAECAAGMVRVGGSVIVSGPPLSRVIGAAGAPGVSQPIGRWYWSRAGCETMGLQLGPLVRSGSTYRALRKVRACPTTLPRSAKALRDRPGF
jgi:precorrin-6B methylase 2